MANPRHLVGGNGDSRDTQTGRAATSTSQTIPATADEACWLCRTGEPDNRWGLCDRCTGALFRQLRRRREAAARCEPLPDGRRDPAGPVADGRWTA
jgi:hypothetical protein